MSDERLDEALRQRLQSAAEMSGDALLGADAQERVIAAVLRESVALARARKRRRIAIATSVALAACALIGVLATRPAEEVATTTTEACALPFASVADARFEDGKLSLGALGTIGVGEGSLVEVTQADACTLVVALTHGELASELHSLSPARLRVHTPRGDVLVRGTTFSVHADDALEVVLLHGAVDVELGATASTRKPERVALAAGHVLVRKPSAPTYQVREVEPADRARVEALLVRPKPVVVAEAPVDEAKVEAKREPTTRDLFSEAEAARRAGDLQNARALYRRAGAQRGPDADVAVLRWARMELDAREPKRALTVLQRYAGKITRSDLAAEGRWLELLALDAAGRRDDARAVARTLVERYSDTPHAAEARRFLSR